MPYVSEGADPGVVASPEAARHHARTLRRALPQISDVVRLAADVAGTSAGAVNIVHADGQETVAVWGADAASCSLEDSMCRVAILENGPVHVHDAGRDPRFAANPWVTGELGRVSFYCAVPLKAPDDTVFGTLCVWDERAREASPTLRRRLDALACHVEDLLVAHDHSDLVASAIDALTHEHQQLHRSNELLSQFAGQVAHDLRAPMSTIRLSLGLLRQSEHLVLDDQAHTLLDRVDDAGRRMEALINGFLALAALDGQTIWEAVDLNELLTEVLDDLGPAARRHELRLGNLPVVRGDLVQLRALVQNLVGNALKFSGNARSRVVRVSGGGAGESWWLEVADSGPGVLPELREAVFEPLVRADASVEGLGLGLAACRRIATNHHAELTILDAPEGGALMWLVASPPPTVSQNM